MSQSIYEVTVPTLLRALSNLSGVLDKGSAHCEREKIDPSVMLSARLYPDMFALTRQVQIAADMSKGGAARLAGIEIPKFADDESSFAELKARLGKTTDFIRGIDRGRFQGAAERAVEVKVPQRTLSFANGWDYLLGYVLPNVHFHSTTAYDILRHNGVKLGKGDYLGAIGQG